MELLKAKKVTKICIQWSSHMHCWGFRWSCTKSAIDLISKHLEILLKLHIPWTFLMLIALIGPCFIYFWFSSNSQKLNRLIWIKIWMRNFVLCTELWSFFNKLDQNLVDTFIYDFWKLFERCSSTLNMLVEVLMIFYQQCHLIWVFWMSQ